MQTYLAKRAQHSMISILGDTVREGVLVREAKKFVKMMDETQDLSHTNRVFTPDTSSSGMDGP